MALASTALRLPRFQPWPRQSLWVCFGLLCLTILVYWPGLSGDFEFDDGVNIFENAALKIEELSWESLRHAALSGSSGPLGRPISMLSFGLNYWASGFSPFHFKLTNLVIHLLAGVAVFFLSHQLVRAFDESSNRRDIAVPSQSSFSWVPLAVAGVWLVHPLNLTSVLYVVQRMSSFAALFSFLAVGAYVLARRHMMQGHYRRSVAVLLLGALPLVAMALFSKENGALAPLLMLVAEVTVFRFAMPTRALQKYLICAWCLLLLPALVFLVFQYEKIYAFVLAGYQSREFTLAERLLTQPRVLLFYIKLFVFPTPSEMGIYHDDIAKSVSIDMPEGTGTALMFWSAMGFTAIIGLWCARVLAFAILWFLVGHSMESSFIALEMAHEHRNYLPTVGLIFAFFYYVSCFDKWSGKLLRSVTVLLVVFFAGVTFVRAIQWGDLIGHAAVEVRNHPESLRANYQMARLYFKLYSESPSDQAYQLSRKHFDKAAGLSGISVFADAGLIQLAHKARQPHDRKWVEQIRAKLWAIDWEPNMVAVNNLLICQLQFYCTLADEEIVGILNSAKDSPRSSRKTRGSANSMLGNYIALKRGDNEGAATYLQAAVLAEPERLQYQLDYVGMLLVLGRFAEASKQLAETQRYATSDTNAAEIAKQIHALDELLAKGGR